MITPDTCIFFICYIFTDMNIQKVQVTTFSTFPPTKDVSKTEDAFPTFSRVKYERWPQLYMRQSCRIIRHISANERPEHIQSFLFL